MHLLRALGLNLTIELIEVDCNSSLILWICLKKFTDMYC